MDKLKDYYEDLKALFSCILSRRPSSAYEPCCVSPPIVSFARDSSVVSTRCSSGLGIRDITVEHLEDVGGRRDATLPLYTVASLPTTTRLKTFGEFAHQAFTSVFVHVLIGSFH